MLNNKFTKWYFSRESSSWREIWRERGYYEIAQGGSVHNARSARMLLPEQSFYPKIFTVQFSRRGSELWKVLSREMYGVEGVEGVQVVYTYLVPLNTFL